MAFGSWQLMVAGGAAVEPPVSAPEAVLGLATAAGDGEALAVGDALALGEALAPAEALTAGLADGLAAAVVIVRQINVSWPYLANTASSMTAG